MDHVTASHVVDSWHIYIILLQISARSADILVFLGNTRSGRKQFVTSEVFVVPTMWDLHDYSSRTTNLTNQRAKNLVPFVAGYGIAPERVSRIVREASCSYISHFYPGIFRLILQILEGGRKEDFGKSGRATQGLISQNLHAID